MDRSKIRNAKTRPGLDYTARQLAILDDLIPIDQIRSNELVRLMKKAKERNDGMNYDVAYSYLLQKQNPRVYIPQRTIEESMAILQSLTPWPIQWE